MAKIAVLGLKIDSLSKKNNKNMLPNSLRPLWI